jgi:DNA-binding transcriptional LysR family regulator
VPRHCQIVVQTVCFCWGHCFLVNGLSQQFSEEHGVPQGEHALVVKPRRVPDWETVRIFLEVARCGSFRAASDKLGQSINALRRKVDEIEHALGVILLTRHVDGVRATAEGEEIYQAALRMETASFDLVRARNCAEKDVEGEVRLAVTEGLGTFWLAPRLVEFQRANPKLMVNLTCAMKSADVLRLEADVSIQLERPVIPDLRMAKIGRLHLMFFAAKSYLDTYGYPKTVSDLQNHRLVIQSDDDKRWRELYDRLFPGISPIGFVSLRSNVASAHYWSIAKGAGIGMLATYGPVLGAQLVPLDIGVNQSLDIWMAYHPDVKRIARVKRIIDWILQSFDPQRFPWFRDEFIHPEKLAEVYRGEPLVNTLFAGYMATPPCFEEERPRLELRSRKQSSRD